MLCRPLIACFYSKRTFWFNPHVDYLILYTPILVAGPLIWRFTIMSFTEALYLLFIALSLMPTLFTPLMFWDKNMSFGQIMKLSVSQSIVFWILMVFTSSIHLLFLSLSRMNYGSGTIVDLFSSVCLFGVVFPILRTVATQGARRGLNCMTWKNPQTFKNTPN
ncbi:hypothetical protein BC829DRAFT_231378 [Chytridium lagenaria]|nr:hypothetical protein BC829DRAFT_231378 [Chytridium lagenaria]